MGAIALKKGTALLLTAAAVLAGLFVADSNAAPNALTCEGYPQPRVFVDAQSWWKTTPGMSGTDFGHVHVGACIPERETLLENTQLDVRVMLHDNPGQLDEFELVYHGADYETVVEFPQTPPFTCPNPGTCEWWLQVPIDLSLFNHAGLQELRFRAFEDVPDGNDMIASLDWQVYVENGAPRMNQTRLAFLRGKGWYSGSGYCEAGYTGVPLPKAPLSGVWSPRLRMVNHGDIGDLPVTAYSMRLDPDFHADPMNEGTVLREGLGEFPEQQVPIDTTLLHDGHHRLFLRADCDDPRGSTNSGVLVVNFISANGSTPTASATSPPTLTPAATPSSTATATATSTPTPTATSTPTETTTPTVTATPTPTALPAPTATPTEMSTPTATATPTEMPTPTATESPTSTSTVTPTPTVTPSWTDSDSDGWNDAAEVIIGTDAFDACPDSPVDDAWPPDLNNDGSLTGFDLSGVAGVIGQTVPPAPARKDIAAQPPDGAITGADLSSVAGRIGTSCSP